MFGAATSPPDDWSLSLSLGPTCLLVIAAVVLPFFWDNLYAAYNMVWVGRRTGTERMDRGLVPSFLHFAAAFFWGGPWCACILHGLHHPTANYRDEEG